MIVILTESKSFGAAGLHDEGGCSHEREETARNDEIHHVIARLAAQMKGDSNARKRRFAAFVHCKRLVDRKIC